MVDFQSHFRMYGHGYTCPDLKSAVATHRELYHDHAQTLFKRRPKAHDCRIEMIKEHEEKPDWEEWLLSHGLNATCRAVQDINFKEIADRPGSGKKRKPDKLITTVGLRGGADGDFVYPRGLCTTTEGDIVVADTGNNRIQVLNNFGVFKKKFGSKGSGEGQFDEPTGVTELPNGDLPVADKNNKRVQVFNEFFEYKYQFPTVNKPHGIASDKDFNIIVTSTSRTVEIFRRVGTPLHSFSLGGKRSSHCGLYVAANNKDEVIISDSMENLVKFYTYTGRLLYKFEPVSNNEGLAVMAGGVCVTPLDQIVVTDSLNHTVNLYTERGILLQQILSPPDNTGTVQACALGPEGHLITAEFSILGEHCIKIFRYRSCQCHESRPGSSKRRTPTQMV